ncbi:hypothetical protein AVEN_51583-1 [Araneus ventricosus]|uniref:Uncharacterized protein n=1 Tax=Araneus ventricosus TaxID=182803 RepID=A0A4Y2LVI9_ARAVE|nr:hypothetical protein AVEN_51583-1 [Araneus ventricosus]
MGKRDCFGDSVKLDSDNRDSTVETNSDIFFLPSTGLPLQNANRSVLFPYAFTEYPESILYCIWYIKSILPNFPESEQRSANISSNSRRSTAYYFI